MSIIGHGTAGQGLRQPESAPFDPVAGDLIGLKADNGLCITDYQQGQFYPPVAHYLTDDSALFAWCAEVGCDETINDLEKRVEQSQWQTIQLRDLFAAATLIGEFAGNRGTASAVTFAYTIADQMLKVREIDDRKPTSAERKATERVANKIINQMKGFDHGF